MTTTQEAPISMVEEAMRRGDHRATPDPNPQDAPDAQVTELSTGVKAAYRNQRVTLYVLEEPSDGQVGVLDLTHQRYRKVPTNMVVPARPDDPAITMEQVKWLGQWLATQRDGARRGAQRGLNNGSWSETGMHETLAKLDIQPKPKRLTNSVDLRVAVRMPPGVAEPTRRQVQDLLNEALRKDFGAIEVTSVGAVNVYDRWRNENS